MPALDILLIPAAKMPSFRRLEPPYPARISVVLSRRLRSCGGRWISRPIRAFQSSENAGGEGGDGDACSSSTKRLNLGKQLLNIASNNFLPLALVSGVVLGLANPIPGCLADKYSLSKFSTFGIFFISGLTLRSDAVGAAVKSWSVGVFGLCSILFFTPLFSRLIMQIQLQPQELVTGLAIFSCMPTTLSSGVALTHLAGGNSALALAMTLISNLLGILIIPFSISKYIAAGVGISIPTEQLFKSLIATLLIPLIIGKVVRESFRGLPDYVDQNRKLFSKISAICLSLIFGMFACLAFVAMLLTQKRTIGSISVKQMVPWMQVSRSRSLLLMVKPAVFLAAVGMGILLHLSLLAFNALSVRIIASVSGGRSSAFSNEANTTAVLLVASQKTLPVMVAVVQQLGGAFGESGLLVLPCVAAHLIQIVMDSFLVNFWLQKYNIDSSASPKIA